MELLKQRDLPANQPLFLFSRNLHRVLKNSRVGILAGSRKKNTGYNETPY